MGWSEEKENKKKSEFFSFLTLNIHKKEKRQTALYIFTYLSMQTG